MDATALVCGPETAIYNYHHHHRDICNAPITVKTNTRATQYAKVK